MTRRIALVITGVVVATLVLAGVGTLVVGSLRARHTTLVEVRRQAVDVAGNVASVIDDSADTPALVRRTLASLNLFRTALNVDGLAVLTAQNRGVVGAEQLPPELDISMFPEATLRAGTVISGTRGSLVFAAAPAVLPTGRLIVIVLFRKAESGVRAAWGTFLLAAAITLLLGIAAAVMLGRRLSRPIREASAATRRIARGELSTRLPTPGDHQHDELSDLARSVNVMAGELDRAQVLEQQFLLSVSHDLRTPLTSIRGYSEAIRDEAADPKYSAEIIGRESRRLERLVADLLDLAKLRAHGFSLHVEPIDLAALAVVAVQGFEPDAAERRLTLRVHGEAPVIVHGDHDRLAQVAANLIENALRHARTTVTVTVAGTASVASLVVDDDGAGIAPADLPHVFERLYVARSQPSRQESSSGLGLAIVKELVEAMHGTVAAAPAPGGGARFTVTLPLAPPASG
jgi:two-component system sensor histidine kinase BaeS